MAVGRDFVLAELGAIGRARAASTPEVIRDAVARAVEAGIPRSEMAKRLGMTRQNIEQYYLPKENAK